MGSFQSMLFWNKFLASDGGCSEGLKRPAPRPWKRPNEAQDEMDERNRAVRRTHCVSS